MKQVDIKSIVIPNKPRSGNYPVGSTVVRRRFRRKYNYRESGRS